MTQTQFDLNDNEMLANDSDNYLEVVESEADFRKKRLEHLRKAANLSPRAPSTKRKIIVPKVNRS
jgi:hypothetical protein